MSRKNKIQLRRGTDAELQSSVAEWHPAEAGLILDGESLVMSNSFTSDGNPAIYEYTAENKHIPIGRATRHVWYGATENLTLVNMTLTPANHKELTYNAAGNARGMIVYGLENITSVSANYASIGGQMDFRGAKSLTSLNCFYNSITILYVSGLTSLTNLRCAGNQLTTLDVSGLTSLATLSCGNNQLTTLDVSGLTNLETLSCASNQLIILDVTGLTQIRTLDLKNNPLNNNPDPLPIIGLNTLTRINVIKNIRLQNCGLTDVQLDAIYTSLFARPGGPAWTIYVKGNPGIAGHTTTIATTKGWTVDTNTD